MSDYAHRPGGSLKFKGQDDKKKKKKSHSSTEHAKALDKERVHEKSDEVDVEVKGTPPLGNGEGTGGRKLTEAERRFEETQRQRRAERVAKLAKITHKDRVSELNSKLDKLSEHHDLPRFFQNDVVTKFADPRYRGKVLRCWADEESDLPPLLPHEELHPLDRPLKRGEVGITHMLTGELAIVSESSLLLYQREFLKGDVVKRSLVAVESAVVVRVKTEVQLEHVASCTRPRGWVPYEKLRNALYIEARDKVVYDEWVGTVEEVFEDGLVATPDDHAYRIAEMGGLLEPGRFASEVIADDHDARIIRSGSFRVNPPSDRIIEVRPVAIYVTWNAINQTLPIEEQGKHPEPSRFWAGPNMKKLTHFDATVSQPPPLGTTVVFRDDADINNFGVITSSYLKATKELKAMKVVESRSRVTLRWQDGTETQDWASELVPYHNIDDYETWPGEHLVWRGDSGDRRPAVVQSFNPHQRVADILFMDSNEKQTVSVLELDPGGSGRTNYGVGFGQQVLLCAENGAPLPEVPLLGQFDPRFDNHGWRNDLTKLADSETGYPLLFQMSLPEGKRDTIDWWGEVVQLHLDGTVSVQLANSEQRRVGIKNVHLLNDPHADPMYDSPMEGEEGMSEDGDELMLVDEVDEAMGSEASWETLSRRGSGVITTDSEAMPEEELYIRPIPLEAEGDDLGQVPQPDVIEAGPSTPPSGQFQTQPSLQDDEEWQHFQMLEEAPQDHHFIREPRLEASSKAYRSRLQKERRALMSSLPENIIVRTYEDRIDLMRCLIIGPEGTPYADAPFVFDIYLNPTKFPHEPPLVHFHSHTNGKGRCNPNLYEDGKVCLSILGTWSGDKSESWNPAKSSLLQVFVSISGLVLVHSPYHCEPAFAKLEGTREGKVNSRLYSEKAYVLSRSFVRTVLEHPPTGLAEELRYLYFRKGRLNAVIDHAERLMEKGEVGGSGSGGVEEENAEMWNADAMGSLTMGAIIMLKRTITALEKILAETASA